MSLIPSACSALLLLISSAAFAAESPPVLYGGPGPDAEQERLARQLTGTKGETRWFLGEDRGLLPDLHALGRAGFQGCQGERSSRAGFDELSAAARESLELILPEEASRDFEQAAELLPCLDQALSPEELASFQFDRGIAALTGATPDQELGLLAFREAITADPDLPWNEDYSALPRSVFFEAKVALLDTPRARIWLATGSELRVLIEGRPLGDDPRGVDLLAGSHLLRVERGEESWVGRVELPAEGQLLLGDSASLWGILVGQEEQEAAERSLAARRGLTEAHGGPVVLTRPGAWAHCSEDGVLGDWSDEGAYRPRLVLGLVTQQVWLEPTIDSPPVDVPNPSAWWTLPGVRVGLQFSPSLSLGVGGGLGWSGPFEVGGSSYTRLQASAQVGLRMERPQGWLRPGASFDVVGLFPGRMSVGGEQRQVVLLGPVGAASLSVRVTDLVWLQLCASGGWVGSATASAGLGLELRFPPFAGSTTLD